MELAIKLEHFNANFLTINIINLKKNNFSNIIYNSPTIILHNLIFPTPSMEMLSGIFKHQVNDIAESNTKYFTDLSFNGLEADTHLLNFFNCINDLDDFVIDFLHKHKYELNITTNIDNIYSRQIKKRSPNHPPIIRLKLYSDSVKMDLDGNLITIDDVVTSDNYLTKAVIKCNGLRCYNGKYSLSWEIIKMHIKMNQSLINTKSSLYLIEEYNKEFIDCNRDINEEEKQNISMLSNEMEHLENNQNVLI